MNYTALRDVIFELESEFGDDLDMERARKWAEACASEKNTDYPCLFDRLSEEDRSKPMHLSCPCPKCTQYC